MFNHSHIRHFSSVFVSLRDFQLITQNSSENIASRQSRCIYVNDYTCLLFMPDYLSYRILKSESALSIKTSGRCPYSFSFFGLASINTTLLSIHFLVSTNICDQICKNLVTIQICMKSFTLA